MLAYEDLVRHDADPEVRATPDGEAYVLYTSGSTGRPKPVAQVHRNVLHHTRVWTDGLRIGPGDRLTLQSAYSWDSAVQDTFAALLNGAALYPVDLKSLGVGGLLEWMARESLTVYHSTLPVFRALVRAMESRGTALPAMRLLALGGDTLHLSDLDAHRRAFGPHCQVAGAYGSTECSCALLRVEDPGYRPPTGVFPLGLPVVGTTVRLQDAEGGMVEGPARARSSSSAPTWRPGPSPRTCRTAPVTSRGGSPTAPCCSSGGWTSRSRSPASGSRPVRWRARSRGCRRSARPSSCRTPTGSVNASWPPTWWPDPVPGPGPPRCGRRSAASSPTTRYPPPTSCSTSCR